MKRIAIISASILSCLLLLLPVIALTTQPALHEPKLVAVTSQPSWPFTTARYEWSDAVTLQKEKTWIWALSGPTHWHCYLYDLRAGLVEGELLNGANALFNGDQTKLLCQGFGDLSTTLKERIVSWLSKTRYGKRFGQNLNRTEDFWILDLKNNSVRRIGSPEIACCGV